MATKADWRAYIDLAKSFDILTVAKDIGCNLKKATSTEWVGPCPIDGGRDRFSISTRKQLFNCRGSSDGGGDVIKMVCHCFGCEVAEACERITGQPRPDRSRDETMEERAARMRENASRMEAARIRQEAEREVERDRVKRDEEAVSDIIDRAVALDSPEGAYGEEYLRRARGLVPNRRLLGDIRFVRELDYWGIPDNGSADLRKLAVLPAVIALIRNYEGNVIGISQTYLDPKEPRKWRPIGNHRNSAKKVRGQKKGGMIRLGRLSRVLAIGEGWENPLAWRQLGGALHIDDLSLAGAVDIGNLSGQSLGKVVHPHAVDPEGAKLRIQSGIPDPANPGVIIPEGVEDIIIVCDANSDQARTAAHYRTAGARFREDGRRVQLAWPPNGYDWNDVLLREREQERKPASVG
jgi:hypothetical protein